MSEKDATDDFPTFTSEIFDSKVEHKSESQQSSHYPSSEPSGLSNGNAFPRSLSFGDPEAPTTRTRHIV